MEITYTWHLVELRRLASNGFVVQIHYDAIAQRDNLKANEIGVVQYEQKDNFIPFENLTKNDIEQWLFASVDKAAVEQKLTNELMQKEQNKTVSGFPWN